MSAIARAMHANCELTANSKLHGLRLRKSDYSCKKGRGGLPCGVRLLVELNCDYAGCLFVSANFAARMRGRRRGFVMAAVGISFRASFSLGRGAFAEVERQEIVDTVPCWPLRELGENVA
jgi:hypothetical protein